MQHVTKPAASTPVPPSRAPPHWVFQRATWRRMCLISLRSPKQSGPPTIFHEFVRD